ncbi:MAG: hypothetical protein K2O12_02805, partial [Muribaculaceae bacterium]|nr:hypothetical protein [Muribaculaceae bacterium]
MTIRAVASLAAMCAVSVMASSCSGKTVTADNDRTPAQEKSEKKRGKSGGPQLGTPGGGPVIDKSGDTVLQAMIKAEVPEFKQLEFKDAETGKTISYNLFSPKNADSAKKYPLVLFMADASTPGTDVSRPLTQGYGALVWATDQWQAENPCYV